MLLVDAQRRGDVVRVEPGQAAHRRRLVREQRQAGRGLEVDITRGSVGA